MIVKVREFYLGGWDMTKLSVNLDKIAWYRNIRDVGIPNLVWAAETCMCAGAHGITVHPRPDERHIMYADVYDLAGVVTVEFNIEGNPFLGRYMEVVRDVRPTQCTLVPDAPDAPTSLGGWNLGKESERLIPIVQELKELGVRVSLFLEPELAEVERAVKTGADRVELRTTDYAAAFQRGDVESLFSRYAYAAGRAQALGLGLNAGHDLNLQNLAKFCSIGGILEVSIGHALIADALELGLFNAVEEYLKVLSTA